MSGTASVNDLAERLTNHVQSRGGPAKDENGVAVGTAWPMMLEAAARIRELELALKFADEHAKKIEALLEPHVKWSDLTTPEQS